MVFKILYMKSELILIGNSILITISSNFQIIVFSSDSTILLVLSKNERSILRNLQKFKLKFRNCD